MGIESGGLGTKSPSEVQGASGDEVPQKPGRFVSGALNFDVLGEKKSVKHTVIHWICTLK